MKRRESGHTGHFKQIIVLAVLAALALSPLPVTSAAAAPPVPSVALPPDVDLADAYEGQSMCDPTPKPGTLKLRDTLWRTYGSSIWAGISRDCKVTWDKGISEHKDGRAIDWGVSVRNGTKAIGDEFFNWVTANNGEMARRMGIMYLIWDSRMWRVYDMDRGFPEYSKCLTDFTSTSYDTTCHRDHMHISMTWHGAGAWTSWYDSTSVTQRACRAGNPVPARAGALGAPAAMFDPLAGVGVAGGRPCFLGKSIQALKVPLTQGRQATQRIRVTHLDSNAPSAVKIWTSAGSSVSLNRSATYPAEFNLSMPDDGIIYVQQPVGQTGIRIEGLGQTLPMSNQSLALGAGRSMGVKVVRSDLGVPAGAKAVTLNVTVTEPQAAGFLRVYPCGEAMPATSNVNFVAGQTVANAVTVGVGKDGQVCLFSSATTHVVVDYSGYFPASSPFTPQNPQRLKDTRSGSKPTARSDVAVPVPSGAAVALSIAVTEPAAAGWVAAYPCGEPYAGTSNVNYSAGQTIAASVIAKPGKDGRVCFRTSAPAHLVADLMGVFKSGQGFDPLAPRRLVDTRSSPGTAPKPYTEFSFAPGVGASAVALNLTATEGAIAGWIQAYPCGTTPPSTSSVNFAPRQTIANSAIVAVGGNGRVCIRSMASTHFVVDLIAAFPPGGGYFNPATPSRIADTRVN